MREKWKASDSYQRMIDRINKSHMRQFTIDLLREKYRLSFFEVQNSRPEEVQERQRQYQEHLDRLKKIWDEEDAKERKS